jgi:L-aminopeptidase/D-esterase-like protein
LEVAAIGAIAAEVLSDAILRAVVNAKGILGIPSYRDIHTASLHVARCSDGTADSVP